MEKTKVAFTPIEQRELYFVSPCCGEKVQRIDHIKIGETSTDINCRGCGTSYDIKRLSDTAFEHSPGDSPTKYYRSLTLLRSRYPNIKGSYSYIVIASNQHEARHSEQPHDLNEGKEYYYGDHTCPWNWLDKPIMEDGNEDPHGIYVHQETVAWPKPEVVEGFEFDGHRIHLDSIDAWYELFPSLKNGEGINYVADPDRDDFGIARTLNELQLMIWFSAVRDGTAPNGVESVAAELLVLTTDGFLRKDADGKFFITDLGIRYINLLRNVDVD